MVSLLTLPERWKRRALLSFSKRELAQIMTVYGQKVAHGEWRDYAVDRLQDMAVFSIFRHSHEQPLYTVTKIRPQNHKKASRYIVAEKDKTLAQGTSLPEVLSVFQEERRK